MLKSKQAEAEKELARQTDIRAIADLNRDALENTDALVKTAIDEKQSVDAFRDAVNEQLRAQIAKPTKTPRIVSGKEKQDLAGYSLVKAIREQSQGNLSGLEKEMHQEAEKEMRASGGSVSGLGVPSMLLRSVNVATEGEDIVQTNISGFIDLLRNKMVVQSLGAQVLSGLQGDLQIPRQSGGVTAEWEGEEDANAEGDVTLDNITLRPNRLGCLSVISKQLLIQSTPDIEQIVRNDLAAAIALAMDLAAINGSGSGNQPTGILNTAGIGSVSAAGVPSEADIIALETAVAVANADVGNLAYLTNPAIRGVLRSTAREAGTDASKIWDRMSPDAPLCGYRCGVSNQVPSNLGAGTDSAIIFGNWADLIIAQWGGLDIVVDPFTAAQNNQVRLIVNTFADIAVRHPESFAAITDAASA